MVSLPSLLADPEKLTQLAQLLDVPADTLRATIALDYQHRAGHPAVYAAVGAPKAGHLLHALEQCKLGAAELEARTNSSSHVSHTIQHVQAHLALVVDYYESRLRGALAPVAPPIYGELLRWRELLAIGPSLHAHQLDEPVLATITDHYGDTTTFPLKLEYNPAGDGERAVYTNEAHEDYQLFDVDKAEEEEGVIFLRGLPAGVPLLAFNYMDEDGDTRDEKLSGPPLSAKPAPLFGAGPAPLFDRGPDTGPNPTP